VADRVGMDLLVYHDMTDYLGADLSHGADAGKEFGDTFAGYHVVATGSPIHEGKDVTVVLAFGKRPMPEIQALLDKLKDS
jgi:hypothetical protein